ncbi:MAG: hypothetical protein JXD18_15435 [Anaerolineae bacterium]|nr:hypothetical protein [Anaerolineae bacterium]
MEQSVWFTPAVPTLPADPLARYRSPELPDAARGFIEHLTAPGDVVIDLFCQGPALVKQAAQAGRRAIGASVNPINLLIARLELDPPPDLAQLNAALTRLGDAPKGDRPLRRHMADVYRTRCVGCGADGVARWFAWDGEAHYPFAKAVHCLHCGDVEGPTDEADIAAARRFPAKGLPYHYVLGRAAPPDHPARERAEELVALYTPRNLAALVDVTMRVEGLALHDSVRAALHGALLQAFDRGSSLDAADAARERPRVLRPPLRFLERNVWLQLEAEVALLMDRPGGSPDEVRRVVELSDLLADESPGIALLPSAAREVSERLSPQSAALILVDPPRPDGVFWALCALWACWLWDSPAAHVMRPFLARRRFDWEWHREAMQAALAAVGPLLAPDGHLVTFFDEPEDALMESVCQAAACAGYALRGWGSTPRAGRQLVWHWVGRPAVARAVDWPQRAAGLARACLTQRAEPTPWSTLHAAVCTGLAQMGCPQSAAYSDVVAEGMERLPLERLAAEHDLRWLRDLEHEAVDPLADRVERWIERAFFTRPIWAGDVLLGDVYRHLNGPLTPDRDLVVACLDSYGVRQEAGWQLREEDLPPRRGEEVWRLREDLAALGERLGFQVRQGEVWDVRWQEAGQDVYLFVFSTTAELGRPLLAGLPVAADAIPCLVFPGGRAELVAHKLQRDPRLARAVGETGWRLLKFRHLRRLIAEGLERPMLEAVLGLDPVTGRGGVQIPLLLGGKR